MIISSRGAENVPVLQCIDWLGEDCIARRVVDTEKQWLVFCYDEIENKNENFIEIAFIFVFHRLSYLFFHTWFI